MYKSPITIIESTIDSFAKTVIEQRENAIFAQIQDSFGVDLDKHELFRALQYDRGQYVKGYADGKANAMAEVVRCKDCKHYDKDAVWCNKNSYAFGEGDHNWYEDDFCSYGERRTDGNTKA